jgi:septum formation protein
MTATSRPRSLLYSGDAPFILASRSPRREAILRQLGVRFLVRPADVDERGRPGLLPRELAMRAAARKAAAVARGRQRGLVLGADTVVVLDGEVLGKPSGARAAAGMLARLSGRTHVVTTGLALIDVERGVRCLSWEDTRVHMRAATRAEIAAYVATGEPFDKAGAYGIQGHGALFVDRIEGCYWNVVGLPVARLRSMLADVLGAKESATPVRRRGGR